MGLALLLACVPRTASTLRPAAQVSQALPQAPAPAVRVEAAPIAPETVTPAEAARTWTAPAEPALGSFAGRWQSHSFLLDIDAQGSGAATWRTYRWCSSAPPPCDDMRDNLITPGGRATFVVHDAGEQWVDIDVVESSDPASVPLGPARLALMEAGRLRLIVESAASTSGTVDTAGARGLAINLCRPGAVRSTACGA